MLLLEKIAHCVRMLQAGSELDFETVRCTVISFYVLLNKRFYPYPIRFRFFETKKGTHCVKLNRRRDKSPAFFFFFFFFFQCQTLFTRHWFVSMLHFFFFFVMPFLSLIPSLKLLKTVSLSFSWSISALITDRVPHCYRRRSLEKINMLAGLLKKVPLEPVDDTLSRKAEAISDISRKSWFAINLTPCNLPKFP